MSEATMWTATRSALVKSPRDDAVRVENPAWPGTPDVHWCCSGVEGWLELKQVAGWPARGGNLAVDHFTAQQRVWLIRRSRAGGRVHLLLKVGVDWLLFEGATAAQVVGRTAQDRLCSSALLVCLRKLDHEKLRSVLAS